VSKRRFPNQTTRVPLPLLIALWAIYGVLAVTIRRNPVIESDIRVTRALQSNEHPWIERFMTFVSWFGFRPQSLLLPLGTILTFWFRGRRIEAILLVAAWGSSMVSFLTKQVVRRPRPDHAVVRVVLAKVRDTSFPSGHVVHYVTFWGFVSYLLLFRTAIRPFKWIAGLFMVPIIALVGPSRVYLGHHWFTDVLGSYLLGGAYLAGLIEARRILRDASGEADDPACTNWMNGARQWLR
jgi:membrane-associated phospholipid phosphatase